MRQISGQFSLLKSYYSVFEIEVLFAISYDQIEFIIGYFGGLLNSAFYCQTVHHFAIFEPFSDLLMVKKFISFRDELSGNLA